jgi:heat shock protein 4
LAQATSADDKYAHIDDKDKTAVVEKCATVQKWLDDQIARQAERPKNEDPVLRVADVVKKREEVVYFVIPILTKPKPKPVKVDTPNGPGTQTPQSGTQTPDPGAKQQQQQQEGPSEMDVD